MSVEAKRIVPADVVRAYLQTESFSQAARATYYGLASARRISINEGAIPNQQGRPSFSIGLRERVWHTYENLGNCVDVFHRFWSVSALSYETVTKIVSRRKERRVGLFGIAVLILNDNGEILICQEKEEWLGYKSVGDWTIPMGKRGKKESPKRAIQRMVQRELFASPEAVATLKKKWEKIFLFSEGGQPLGGFWIADALVFPYVVQLKMNPSHLGGFTSQTVDNHTWVNPGKIVAGDLEIPFRRGAREMIRIFVDCQNSPPTFEWGKEYDT